MGLAKRKKTTRAAPRRGAKLESPKWDNWEKLSGAEFHRKSQAAREFYYQNYKPRLISICIYMDGKERLFKRRYS